MKELSIEVKKLLAISLPRITNTQVRIVVSRERYLEVLHELEELQRELEKEILDEEGKLP